MSDASYAEEIVAAYPRLYVPCLAPAMPTLDHSLISFLHDDRLVENYCILASSGELRQYRILELC